VSVLITGGTGFIGSRLALDLHDAGCPVRVLGLTNTDAERWNRGALEERGIEVLHGSVTDVGALRGAMGGVEAVVHLAAAQHEMNVPDAHFRDVNVTGTARVLEAAGEAGVVRFVHGSTIGVYGDPTGPVDESTPPRPVNVYGATKLEAEEVVRGARERMHVTVVRIPEVYGPGDRRLLKLFRMIQRGRYVLVGPGRNLHHPLFVDDLVRGLIAASTGDHASGELVLLAGPEPLDTRSMAAGIARAVGKPPPRLRLPLWPFASAALVLETTLRPLGVQPPLHRRRLDFFRKSFSLSGARARRVLGFTPRVGFDEGARRTAEWYALHGFLAALPTKDGA
jgi:nucleoside-diphosphate-sugar epimerase